MERVVDEAKAESSGFEVTRGNRSEGQGEHDDGRVGHPGSFDLGRKFFARINEADEEPTDEAEGKSEQRRGHEPVGVEGNGFGEAVVRMRGPKEVLSRPVRPEGGEEAEHEASELGPADKFQRKDGRCQGRAEDGRKAAADAAEQQGAAFFLGEGEEPRELIRNRPAHLQGRAFASDRRSSEMREEGEPDNHRGHRRREGFLWVLDFRDQRGRAVRAALLDTGVCPDGRCTDEGQGPE